MIATTRRILIASMLMVPASAMVSVSARAETIWLGTAHQWSVGSMDELPLPCCRLVWQGEKAKTVEFRQGQNFIMLLISEDGWNIAPGTKTEIAITDRTSTNIVPAERFTDNTLQLWGNADDYGAMGMKAILGQAFFAQRSLHLSFAADEKDWIVPLADLNGLYQTYVQCLRDLSADDPGQSVGPAGHIFSQSGD